MFVCLFVFFFCFFFFFFGRISTTRKVSESEQETHKLYIAARANSILHMLPELFRNTEQAALGFAVWLGFLSLRVVAAVVNTQ